MAKLNKATPAQIKRDHAISRGLTVKKRQPLEHPRGLNPHDLPKGTKLQRAQNMNMADTVQAPRDGKKPMFFRGFRVAPEHKGIDKHKGVRYTVATIINKFKERKTKIMETPKQNKNTKAKTQQATYCRIDGWRGLAGLFVSASIVYANYVVFYGTQGLIPKLMLVPSTLAVLAFLVHKSLK